MSWKVLKSSVELRGVKLSVGLHNTKILLKNYIIKAIYLYCTTLCVFFFIHSVSPSQMSNSRSFTLSTHSLSSVIQKQLNKAFWLRIGDKSTSSGAMDNLLHGWTMLRLLSIHTNIGQYLLVLVSQSMPSSRAGDGTLMNNKTAQKTEKTTLFCGRFHLPVIVLDHFVIIFCRFVMVLRHFMVVFGFLCGRFVPFCIFLCIFVSCCICRGSPGAPWPPVQ